MDLIIKEKAKRLAFNWWTNEYKFDVFQFKADILNVIQEFYGAKEKIIFLTELRHAIDEDKTYGNQTLDINEGITSVIYIVENELRNLQSSAVKVENLVDSEIAELKAKVDEVIFELKKANIGNEILFGELEEIKELSNSLKKKNWSEIVKGKLVDLALDKVIDKDVLNFLLKNLTGDNINLLQ